MRAVEQWFQAQSAREERAVYLEDALLGGRFAAYAVYRLRFFLGRSLLAAALHIIEFTFLSFIFSREVILSALLVRAASSFASTWWWGALEVMRGQLRSLHRRGKSHLIAKKLAFWYRLAGACSLLVLTLTVVWIGVDVSRAAGGFDVLHLYVFATGLQLSLTLLSRTFHSAVYAIRRIYRPFVSIAGVQLFGFVGTLLAWPLLGHWSFPTMLIPAAVLANAITFVYVRRVYRLLGLGSTRVAWLGTARARIRLPVIREFFLAGASYALMRLDDLLVLALLAGAYHDRAGYDLFLLFYLISPFVRGAYEWAQLFYFDLKRLELDLFVKLKERFTALVRRTAFVMGWLFWALACICGTLLLERNLGILYVLLALFFLVRSQLAFLHIRAFTARRYGALIVTELFVLASVFCIRSLVLSEAERFGLLVLSFFAAACCLGFGGLAALRSSERVELLALPDWLRRLASLRHAVCLRSVHVGRDVPGWSVDQIAGRISAALRGRGALTRIGDRRIAWYELAATGKRLSDSWLLRVGAGLIEGIQSVSDAGSGREALDAARRNGLLGPLIRNQLAAQVPPPGIEQIKRQFRAAFPRGLLYDTAERDPGQLANLTSAQRREIMYGAIRYSKNCFKRARRAQFDVTAFSEQGEIQLIFSIPQTVPVRSRSEWRSFINAANVRCAVGAPPVET